MGRGTDIALLQSGNGEGFRYNSGQLISAVHTVVESLSKIKEDWKKFNFLALVNSLSLQSVVEQPLAGRQTQLCSAVPVSQFGTSRRELNDFGVHPSY